MREIIVTKAEAGQRFDRYLQKYMPGAANGFLHKMLRKKNIKLNGRKAEGKEKIKEGDAIQIFFSEETLAKFTGTSAGNRAVPGKEGTGAGTNGETAPERKTESNRAEKTRASGVRQRQNRGRKGAAPPGPPALCVGRYSDFS